MKPIKLAIQAFGPFVSKEEIDFSVLGHSPLFLINGPTGSGKSSILDAICFALYGKTTGADREASQMRCDQADPKTLTEITLDFSLADKYYRITRSPTQERAKAKGAGLTEHIGEAHLWEINSTGELNLMVTKKLKEVTAKIEDITGLNVEQFRQVMVLPQGKFRELLLADSSDREKIFSRLFQTNIYKRIEDTLKNKAISIANDKKAHDNQIKGILEGADLNTEEAVEIQLNIQFTALDVAKKHKETMNTNLQNAMNQKESAETLLNQYIELENTQTKIKQKEQLKPGIDNKKQSLENAQRAQKITPAFEDLTRVTNEKQQLDKALKDSEAHGKQLKLYDEDAAEVLKKANDNAKDTDQLKQKATELKLFENKVGQLEIATSTAQQSNNIYKKSNQHLLSVQNELDTQVKNKQTLEQKASDMQQKLSNLGPKQVNLQQLDIQKQQMLKLDTTRADYNAQIKQHKLKTDQLTKLKQKYETASIQAKHQEMHWHSGQAAILAKELKKGEPCPVCGSMEHPKPAQLTEHQDLVTKEQVDTARNLADANREVMQDASDKVNKLNSQIEQTISSIHNLEKELGAVAFETLASIEQTYNTLKSEVTTLEKNKKELEKMMKKMTLYNVNIEKLQSTVNQARKQAEADQIQFERNQVAVTHIEKELPEAYRKKSKLLKTIQQIEEKILQLTDALSLAQAKYEQCKTNTTKQEIHHQGLTESDAKLKQQQTTLQNQWQQAIHDSSFDTEQQYKAALLTDAEQDALSMAISTYQEALIHIKGELKQQEKSLNDKSKPDLDKINSLCNEKQSLFTAAENEWKKLDARVNQLNSVKKKLKKAHETNARLEEEYAIYGTLSNVANGRTGNNISLQRFVLSVLLDDVLIEASRRLSLMTKGRYHLLRKHDKSKGNKASGLELDVQDEYTGKNRSVATLSGGESFMAALALALGLSDVVQAYAGGIKLDTLFIDEGFGSLDQESLDLAIRTLIDLQATGRTIGIISHVSELKEQMARRIDVISSKTGSTIKTIAA